MHHAVCIIVPNFIKIDQMFAIYPFFHDGGCLPSWICVAHFEMTHKEYFVVFVTVLGLQSFDNTEV